MLHGPMSVRALVEDNFKLPKQLLAVPVLLPARTMVWGGVRGWGWR